MDKLQQLQFHSNQYPSPLPMIGHQNYVKSIRQALEIGLCIRDMPSELVEKDNKPYVELSGVNTSINPLIMKPIYLCRNRKERFLIQPSINSCRISFTIKKNDTIDQLIAQKISKMLASRADRFEILRRKPVKDYDISFLISTQHLQVFQKQRLIGVIMELVETIEKDLSQIKLSINHQCRIAATWFMSKLAETR